ncbi:hypothetical protein TCAL_15230 [Tigriopus californicus]|uniref:Uncharacterized protein n=1 Tax=Tigriopus californicus TaxID=6832 RepID=A0A553NBZ0_TIGCA|nr:hypothetical protein TCAL_15230 [Tigriopus californicus]
MNSTSTPVCLAALLALVFIASGGIRPVDASGYFGRRVLFVPITSPTSDDTCAADYANKDNYELELLENGLFNQEFLEIDHSPTGSSAHIKLDVCVTPTEIRTRRRTYTGRLDPSSSSSSSSCHRNRLEPFNPGGELKGVLGVRSHHFSPSWCPSALSPLQWDRDPSTGDPAGLGGPGGPRPTCEVMKVAAELRHKWKQKAPIPLHA